jgi:plastocyanin
MIVAVSLMTVAIMLSSCGSGGGGGVYGSSGSNGNSMGTIAQAVQIVPCPASGTTDVSIVEYAFSPASISVPLNAVVRWTNNGTMTHTVTSTTVPTNGVFDSQVSAGSSLCLKFTSAGSFSYHCSIHTSMTGIVTVAGETVGGTTGGTTGGGTGGGIIY